MDLKSKRRGRSCPFLNASQQVLYHARQLVCVLDDGWWVLSDHYAMCRGCGGAEAPGGREAATRGGGPPHCNSMRGNLSQV